MIFEMSSNLPREVPVLFGPPFELTTLRTAGADIRLRIGGNGPPLLLLHGFPQTHAMWHAVAPALAAHYSLVIPDLRGYGESAKPTTTDDHLPYSKRAMAIDMVDVMTALGHDRFFVAGHDRGARVTHRLCVDHPARVRKACVMDIVPTHHIFTNTDQRLATAYYHWFFLIQPDGLPERMIGRDPDYFLLECLRRWSAPGMRFNELALAEYQRCYRNPRTIHAACEDYRAGASIDLVHDAADLDHKIDCPLLVLWGKQGFVNKAYDVLEVWRQRATQVQGQTLDCGHFLPEEQPAAVSDALIEFMR